MRPTSAAQKEGRPALGHVAVALAATSILFQLWVNRSDPRAAVGGRCGSGVEREVCRTSNSCFKALNWLAGFKEAQPVAPGDGLQQEVQDRVRGLALSRNPGRPSRQL